MYFSFPIINNFRNNKNDQLQYCAQGTFLYSIGTPNFIEVFYTHHSHAESNTVT